MKLFLTYEYIKNNVNKNLKEWLSDGSSRYHDRILKPDESYSDRYPTKEFIDIVRKRYNKPIAILHKNLVGLFSIDELYYSFATCTDYCLSRVKENEIFKKVFGTYEWDQKDNNKIIGQVDTGSILIPDGTDEEGYTINDYYATLGDNDIRSIVQLDENGLLYMPKFDKLEFEIYEYEHLKDTPLTREWRLKDLDKEEIIL